MRVAAYVPCFNAGRLLEQVLAALAAQTRRPDEIIVVDDGSTDDSAAIAERGGARVIRHRSNRGIAAARNSARRGTTAEVLVGLDADAIAAPDYIERVLAAFHRDRRLSGVCGRLVESHTVLLPDLWRSVHMRQHHGETAFDQPRICFGSVSSFRTAALDAVGGWQERFRTNHEDVDLTQRLYAAGHRVAYEPDCIARHQRRDTAASVLAGFWRWYAPAGRERGHFASWRSLIEERLEAVTWGVFSYRARQDVERHRPHLVGLTALLPAAMSLGDLSELGAPRASADGLVRRFRERLRAAGATEYVADMADAVLSGVRDLLFVADTRPSPIGAEAFIDAFGTAAARRLPDDHAFWTRVEASLARLDLEQRHATQDARAFRVLLANPPWHTAERQGVRAGSRWPFTLDRRGDAPVPRYVPFPFFLSQAARLLSDHGRPNAIVDAIAEGLTYDEFHERVVGYRPAAIVMETAAASFDNDRRIWRRLRAALPEARLILCGPHATARRGEVLADAPEIDLVLVGEYEQTLLDVTARLENGHRLTDQKGIAYRSGGRIVDNGRPEPVPFDAVGASDRLRLPLFNYRDPFSDLPEPMAQLMATRGCPYECSFCQWPQVFYERRKIQRRSVERVFAEVRELVERFGFRSIYFDDDMFSPGGEWIERFAGLIERHGLDVEWAIMARADTFKDDEWRVMAAAGLRAVKFGVESGDQAMVDAMGKRLKLERLRGTVRLCRELGIRVHLTFTLGLPGETQATLAETRRLILELLPDSLQISRAMPLPGTAFEEWALQNGAISSRDVNRLDGFSLSILHHRDLTAGEIDAFIRETYAEYRLARTLAAASGEAAA